MNDGYNLATISVIRAPLGGSQASETRVRGWGGRGRGTPPWTAAPGSGRHGTFERTEPWINVRNDMTSARDFAIRKMSRQSHKLESLTSSLRCTHPQAQGASSCPEYRGHRESPDKVSHVCRKQKNGSKIEGQTGTKVGVRHTIMQPLHKSLEKLL